MDSCDSESAASVSVNLKLLIDKKSSKVLFAEADKAFVDFLFTLLALPIGTVTSLLKKNEGMVGSLGTLYKSIETLSNSYIMSDNTKEAVLNPRVALSCQSNSVPLLCEAVAFGAIDYKTLYMCSYCSLSNVTDQANRSCPSCRQCMSKRLHFLGQPSAATNTKSVDEVGYVKGVVTYMVMDDLAVKPMSTISSITLLNTFNIKDVGVLDEKVVSLGMPEGLKLLKASLHSKSVLTDVFLK